MNDWGRALEEKKGTRGETNTKGVLLVPRGCRAKGKECTPHTSKVDVTFRVRKGQIDPKTKRLGDKRTQPIQA